MKNLVATFWIVGSLVGAAAPKSGTDYVSQRAIKPARLSAGAPSDVIVSVTVLPGYHIQSNPASRSNLIPTTLQIDGMEKFEVGQPGYPKGKPYRLKGAKYEISTFDGNVDIKLPLKAVKGVPSGEHKLAGTLRFQPCNDTVCFFPTKIPVELTVMVK